METTKGQAVYTRAKQIIPGGTQLLSKRSELYAPGLWPPYAKKASGCTIEDLDGNTFLDFSTMGIGSCLLGYADKKVNEAVQKAVVNGSMCSLNFPEEVALAEQLIELHPWAGMVRYARSGGEILAQAVRIARAGTGKTRIVFCGYHGWHDWYLAGNLQDGDQLGDHLLKGLQPLGVPPGLKGTAVPFHYNAIDELDAALELGDTAAIVMEPFRYQEPENNFLQKVREKANKAGAVLIFDEVTSGWRYIHGGIHQLYSVTPDIAVYAKAISNGFPCAALVGNEEIMQYAQETFISSTYWTERVGSAAAIATIKELKEQQVAEYLLETGKKVQTVWKNAAVSHNLSITIEGRPALTHFSFDHDQPQVLNTLLTQELLDQSILGNTAYYGSFAHKEKHLEIYEAALNKAFKNIAKAVKSGEPETYLRGEQAIKGFTRLT